MRPRKDVVILMRNEDELGPWKVRLQVWGYGVRACTSLDEAIEHTGDFRVFAIATSIPAAAEKLVLRHGHVLLFGTATPIVHSANRLEPAGDGLPTRVRWALQCLTRRQRGPAKKPVVSVRVEELEAKVA